MIEEVSDPIEQAATVMISHQRISSQYCLCGWGELGASHPKHVAQALADAGIIPDEAE